MGSTSVRRAIALSSRPEDSHLRALPDPYVNLSIHTAPDVRPFPWQSCQWAKSVGFTRRNRSNQFAPLGLATQPLELAARPADDIEIDPLQGRTQLRLVEVAVVVDPAANARVVHFGQIL